MKLIAYTDASYRSEYDIAACGFMVYRGNINWVAGSLLKNCVVLIQGVGTICNGEVVAIKEALMWCYLQDGVTEIQINTDQYAITSRVRRGLETTKRYKELQEIVDIIDGEGVALHFKWVKSHSKNKLHNKVDANCSRVLREYIKKLPPKPVYSKKRKSAA